MGRGLLLFVFVAGLCCLSITSMALQKPNAPTNLTDAYSVSKLDGGSVVTPLAYDIKVNGGSSLNRDWYVLNDPKCPLQLQAAGIKTQYKESRVSGDYVYTGSGAVVANEDVTAFEVRFIVFDIFGNHLKTLSATEVEDLKASGSFNFSKSQWRTWENEVSEVLTVVSYVANVRLANGKIWRYETPKLLREIKKLETAVSETQLAPIKKKED
jgi:hypothetical protein